MVASYRPCGSGLKRHDPQWGQKFMGMPLPPASRPGNPGIGPPSPQWREKDCGEQEVKKPSMPISISPIQKPHKLKARMPY